MRFFAFEWVILIAGFLIHVGLDRSPARRTRARIYELAALWLIVGIGVFNILSGLGHIGPYSDETAASIGFTQSMFQWEIGWADIAIGVLGVACASRRNRGPWMTATLVALTISFIGDGIGHVMQLVAHGNMAPNNVWAIPNDFVVPILSIVLVLLYRREAGLNLFDGAPQPGAERSAVPHRRRDATPGPT
jgi:hypothetical protein